MPDRKLEHVKVAVEDLEESLTFYRRGVGLTEIDREDGVVYLGCGRDGRYDMAIEEGGSGLDHAAVRLTGTEFETAIDRLEAAEVETRRVDGAEPGQQRGVQFDLPSDLTLEFVTVPLDGYQHSEQMAVSGRGGLGPLDLDHIGYITNEVKRDAEFLQEIGFSLTEIAGPGEEWEAAFLRRGSKHHDITVFVTNGAPPEGRASLHHVGWELTDIAHLKLFVDRIVQLGVDIELGIGRHHGGDNVFTYFLEPGGNRFELVTEMAIVDNEKPVRAESLASAFSAWGDMPFPESFHEGSGLASKAEGRPDGAR